jgi:CMP-2-keto-3-deoxyoctulosonic acid synthetase
MAKELIDLLNEINNKLNNLDTREVLDVSNLNENEVKIISQVYSKKYFMRGPTEDKENKGKYVLAFIGIFGGNKNA